ncbi:MAG: fluoride efflux transporter CrcB [Proteobacteria bacterium]|nr:fluoride efflux transporter CrcB [Pseudomonadota bacterium]
MRDAILVFIGGGVGSVLRWYTGIFCMRLFGTAFPAGTLAVNIIGCFVMGLLFRVLPFPEAGTGDVRPLLMTGLLGGFTTFSAFALDSAALWMRNEPGLALLYVALSLGVSLLGVALGLFLGKLVMA